MSNDKDVHDKLVQAYLDYFRENESFLQSPSERKRRLARKHLSEIMKLAKERRAEIMLIHNKKLNQERQTRQNKNN